MTRWWGRLLETDLGMANFTHKVCSLHLGNGLKYWQARTAEKRGGKKGEIGQKTQTRNPIASQKGDLGPFEGENWVCREKNPTSYVRIPLKMGVWGRLKVKSELWWENHHSRLPFPPKMGLFGVIFKPEMGSVTKRSPQPNPISPSKGSF